MVRACRPPVGEDFDLVTGAAPQKRALSIFGLIVRMLPSNRRVGRPAANGVWITPLHAESGFGRTRNVCPDADGRVTDPVLQILDTGGRPVDVLPDPGPVHDLF